MKTAVIIGAGPAGLTAAYELRQKSKDWKIIVVEATDVIGGDGDIESTENIYQGDYLPESSDRYLSASDVEGFSRNDLNYAINELYARHGATFTDDDVIAYFSGKDWYSPRQSKEAARSEFTEIEEKNFMFLCDYRDSKYPN